MIYIVWIILIIKIAYFVIVVTTYTGFFSSKNNRRSWIWCCTVILITYFIRSNVLVCTRRCWWRIFSIIYFGCCIIVWIVKWICISRSKMVDYVNNRINVFDIFMTSLFTIVLVTYSIKSVLVLITWWYLFSTHLYWPPLCLQPIWP